MKNPKITVLMSVFNGEEYLREVIESILGQIFQDFEFLIIDDASTDKTQCILKGYRDSRIKRFKNRKNIGLTKSLNKGLKMAKGDFIARQDADDISTPQRLKRQYDYLIKHPRIFLIGTGAYHINRMGKIKAKENLPVNPSSVKRALAVNNCIYHSSIMFRNEKNNFYREKFIYAQDYDFYLTLLAKGKHLNNLNEPLMIYRISPGAISWSKKSKQKLFALTARKFFRQRMELGKDEYDSFNPNEILSIDIEKSNDEIILQGEIEASYELNHYKRTRELCRRYLTHHPPDKTILLYYLRSFYKNLFTQ